MVVRDDTMHKLLVGEYEENILRGSPSWDLKANVGFKYKAWEYGVKSRSLRSGTVVNLYEHSNEPSKSIKCGQFLEQLKD
jgi:hypothetical protein